LGDQPPLLGVRGSPFLCLTFFHRVPTAREAFLADFSDGFAGAFLAVLPSGLNGWPTITFSGLFDLKGPLFDEPFRCSALALQVWAP